MVGFYFVFVNAQINPCGIQFRVSEDHSDFLNGHAFSK